MMMMIFMIVVSDDYVLLHVCTYCIGRRREGLMKFIKFLQDVISGIYIDSQDDHIDSQDDHMMIILIDDHINSQDDHIDCQDDHILIVKMITLIVKIIILIVKMIIY